MAHWSLKTEPSAVAPANAAKGKVLPLLAVAAFACRLPALGADLQAQTPRATTPLEAAHQAFADGRYDEAIRRYEEERRRGSQWSWLPELIRTVEQNGIEPLRGYRDAVRQLFAVHTVRRDGGRSLRLDVVPDQKPTWRARLGVMRRLIEALSGGGWTLAFEEVDAVATQPEGSPFQPADPNHLEGLERRLDRVGGTGGGRARSCP